MSINRKRAIVIRLLSSPKTEDRTQKALLGALGISQTTLVRYLSELKGEGLIEEYRLGTNVVYSVVSLERAAERGYISEVLTEQLGDLLVEAFEAETFLFVRLLVPPLIDTKIPILRKDALTALVEIKSLLSRIGQAIDRAILKLSAPEENIGERDERKNAGIRKRTLAVARKRGS